MTYYTLLVLDDDRWSPQFGDYDRDVVAEECHEYIQQGYRRAQIKLITLPDDRQETIDRKCALLNKREAFAWRSTR